MQKSLLLYKFSFFPQDLVEGRNMNTIEGGMRAGLFCLAQLLASQPHPAAEFRDALM